MSKKSKLATPEWVLEGYKSEEEYEKAKGIKKKKSDKTFKLRKCPKCNTDDVAVVLTGEEGSDEDEPLATSSASSQSKGKGEWECKKCKWKGKDIHEKELSEEEFMKLMEEKEEEVL